MYDYTELRCRIIKKFGTYSKFAEHLKKSNSYVTRYIQGHSEFKQSVIDLWCDALDISDEEISEVFFTKLEQ